MEANKIKWVSWTGKHWALLSRKRMKQIFRNVNFNMVLAGTAAALKQNKQWKKKKEKKHKLHERRIMFIEM